MIEHLGGTHTRCPIAGQGTCAPGEEWAEIGFACKYLLPDDTSGCRNQREAKNRRLVCPKSIAYLETYIKTNVEKDSIMFYGRICFRLRYSAVYPGPVVGASRGGRVAKHGAHSMFTLIVLYSSFRLLQRERVHT